LSAALPYAPYPAYLPPRKDNTVLIVVIVVVILVGSLILPAILYIMVSGLLETPSPVLSKPTVVLAVAKITGGVTILVAGIQPASSPSSFEGNIQNASNMATGAAVPMPTVSGTSVSVSVSAVNFTITWNNVGGSGQVSQGDYFVVTYTAAVGTQWTFLLIWAYDGSVLPTNATWVA
jgi:hypothetical protein